MLHRHLSRIKASKSFIEISYKQFRNFKNIVSLHSLSKRSNLPGFRSGMICGDKELINNFKKYRSFHGVSIPLPIQIASAEAWSDEKIVEDNRRFYNENFYLADKILNYKAPDGAFYMWLRTDNGEKFAKTLFKRKILLRFQENILLFQKMERILPKTM